MMQYVSHLGKFPMRLHEMPTCKAKRGAYVMVQHKRVIAMTDDAAAITQEDITPTILPDAYLTSDVAQRMAAFRLPRYNELSSVSLYRDQVIGVVEQALEPFRDCIDGELLTPSMVNNYVKAGLLPAPVKKQYGREHIARLIVICIFKQVLSIQAISALFRIQRLTYLVDIAFDYVATELENAVHTAFTLDAAPIADTASMVTRESLLVRNAVTAFAAKAYLIGYLHFIGFEDSDR